MDRKCNEKETALLDTSGKIMQCFRDFLGSRGLAIDGWEEPLSKKVRNMLADALPGRPNRNRLLGRCLDLFENELGHRGICLWEEEDNRNGVRCHMLEARIGTLIAEFLERGPVF